MDPTDRQRFLRALRSDETFREDVRRELLSERLLELPDTVAALVDAVAEHSRQIAELTAAVNEQREDIAELRRAVSALIDATAHNSRDISELRQDVASLTQVTRQILDTVQTGFDVMRAAITSLGDTVSTLAAGLAQLRSDMNAGFAATNARLDQVDAEIVDIKRRLAS